MVITTLDRYSEAIFNHLELDYNIGQFYLNTGPIDRIYLSVPNVN